MLNAELNGDGSSLKQTVRRGSVGNLKSQIPNLKQTDKRIKGEGERICDCRLRGRPFDVAQGRRFEPVPATFSHFQPLFECLEWLVVETLPFELTRFGAPDLRWVGRAQCALVWVPN